MDRKDKLFVLTGPTGIGKTSLSLALANRLDGEIISADSMQIYKYMDIGSAKISKDEMGAIPHHLIDKIYPDEEYTVANFKDDGQRLIEEINKKKKLPMVVGGTGLYINSLIYDLSFTKVEADKEIRESLEKLLESDGSQHLHNVLREVDPISADRINPNDIKRVMRAIEIFRVSGKPMSEYYRNFRKPNDKYDLTIVALNMDRKILYSRINDRVDLMFKEGLVEEVKTLLSMGYHRNLISMQGIGYKEVVMYLEGEMDLEESMELIKKASRNYAKRQLTWFRRDDRVKWVNIDEFPSRETVVDYILEIDK